MIGILLLWLAFSPPQSVQVKPAVSQPEQLQPQSAPPAGIARTIHDRFDWLVRQKSPEGGSARALFNGKLERFYAARGFQPVWTTRKMIAELMSAIEGAAFTEFISIPASVLPTAATLTIVQTTSPLFPSCSIPTLQRIFR